jgi:hypothetical protein
MFAPATDTSDIELPVPGRYIVQCVDIQDAPDKGFGPGVKWVFKLIDPQSGVTIQSRNGGDYELWQFTSTKMGPKARARPIIEALLGRPLDVARKETPDSRLLIGRSMIAIVIYEKKEDGTDKAVVSTCQPYTETGAAPTPSAPVAMPRPAPSASGANGAGLAEQLKSTIRKAEVLQTPRHLDWLSLEVTNMSDSDMYQAIQEINADIQAA